MKVVLYDPYQPDGLEKALGVERAYHLSDFWPRCEFLSVHCPLTSETRHIVNAAASRQCPGDPMW